jgi:hypothetical protein
VAPFRPSSAAHDKHAEKHAALAIGSPGSYIGDMTNHPRSRAELLAVLRAHEAELRARGVETITLFGSLARGNGNEMSDVDLAVRPSVGFSSGGI